MSARYFSNSMRVGAYVDAYNLYYGAREICGRGQAGWRWLDIEKLVTAVATEQIWGNFDIQHIVYCTALRESEDNGTSLVDQLTYISALETRRNFFVEYGKYQPRNGKGILAGKARNRRKYWKVEIDPQEQIPTWLPAATSPGLSGGVNLNIHYQTSEEKGSDVNLASHLLIDLFRGEIDAAIVVSNDSDLRFPVEFARLSIPIGVINPNKGGTAWGLRANPEVGAGRHWWARLTNALITESQLPDSVEGINKPLGW